jgi:hypothetical protein
MSSPAVPGACERAAGGVGDVVHEHAEEDGIGRDEDGAGRTVEDADGHARRRADGRVLGGGLQVAEQGRRGPD